MPGDTTARHRATRPAAIAVTAIAAFPLVLLALRLLTGRDYQPFGDGALLELTARDVGHHAVLLGPYSRFGWFHPGPILFYVLALPYRLFGSRSVDLNVGAVVSNAGAFVGIAWIAWRRGGLALLGITIAACLLFLRILGPGYWSSAWNPSVTVLPFAFLLFVSWELSRGELWALPTAAVVATFVVQSHVGYATTTALLLIGALAFGVPIALRSRRAGGDDWRDLRRRLIRHGALAGVLLAVLWAPPLYQQLTHHPGNLGLVVKFARHSHPDHTLHEGFDLELRNLGTVPAWLTGSHFRLDGSLAGAGGWPAVVTLGAFAAGATVAWRRRARDALRLGALVALFVLGSVISTSRIVGPIYDYLVRWQAFAGIAIWIFLAAAFVLPAASDDTAEDFATPETMAGTTTARVHRVVIGGSVAAILLLVVLNTDSAVHARPSGSDSATTVASLTRQVRSSIPRTRAVLIRSIAIETRSHAFGVGLQLERAGMTVRYERDFRSEIGDWRTSDPGRGATTIVFGTGAQRSILDHIFGAREIASSSDAVVVLTSTSQPAALSRHALAPAGTCLPATAPTCRRDRRAG